MALTYTTFATIGRAEGGTFSQTLNVSAWQETLDWLGQLRRAFDGTMLSTLRVAKRRFEATFEFTDGQAYEAFLSYIAVGDTAHHLFGLRRLILSGTGLEASLRGSSLFCYIQPGAATPMEEIVGSVVKLRWSVQMTILES